MAKILVVDDRSTNREYLVALLGHWNHQLLEASDGREALELTRTEHPDLVIADIVMPTMDGYEFLRQLRAEEAISQTRVILSSAAFLEAEAHELAAACGAFCLVTKPCEPQELLERVNAALDSREPVSMPKPDEHFRQDHQRLLTNKLATKVNQVEELNTTLKRRVQDRLAEFDVAAVQMRNLIALREELRQERAGSQRELTELHRLKAGVGSSAGKVDRQVDISIKRIILGLILGYGAGVLTLCLIPWIRGVFHF